ncbi:MAG: hypothetical protein GY798_30910 [Hyphomicrobiales bacterium]|nr:hypothetical protein [Hyphomicrobiales bacterium]
MRFGSASSELSHYYGFMLTGRTTLPSLFGWQWVACSGFDAQPYFRIFNPILQGEKFDPNGDYVRAFVPEIAGLPDRFIHGPWQASPLEAQAAGLKLGETYPRPIVDHAAARYRALEA